MDKINGLDFPLNINITSDNRNDLRTNSERLLQSVPIDSPFIDNEIRGIKSPNIYFFPKTREENKIDLLEKINLQNFRSLKLTNGQREFGNEILLDRDDSNNLFIGKEKINFRTQINNGCLQHKRKNLSDECKFAVLNLARLTKSKTQQNLNTRRNFFPLPHFYCNGKIYFNFNFNQGTKRHFLMEKLSDNDIWRTKKLIENEKNNGMSFKPKVF